MASVVSVSTFLDRLDALESGADRKASRKKDHAALAMLAERGLTTAVRKHMRDLVALVREGAAPATPDTGTAKQQRDDLVALRAWYLDWAETARTAITRRDHLIRLGLAKRKPTRATGKGGGSQAGAAGAVSSAAATKA
jgi:hypothetical protein